MSGKCRCSSHISAGTVYSPSGTLNSSFDINNPPIILECNAKCSCNIKKCNNRVIQNSSRVKLVLFKTKSRGWGIKTIDDIPKGTFIGIYTGELLTAKESVLRSCDTYLFNLSGPKIPIRPKPKSNTKDTISTTTDKNDDNPDEKKNSSYVCDSKYFGNFTRFVNHSCEPNLVGIRSFTSHQDDNFPYIAFFTNRHIQAYQELTLHYGDNYWIVKGKRDSQYCRCKTKSCKFNSKTFQKTYELYEVNQAKSKKTPAESQIDSKDEKNL